MAQIMLPNQLTNGTVADATQVMANFNAIVDVVNGNLGSDNLGSITGADVTVIDLNGGTNTLNNFTSRFQCGELTVSNIPPDDFRNVEVVFPITFPSEPIIFISDPPNTEVSTQNITSSGFKLTVKNEYTTTQTHNVAWLAIYTGAFA